MTQESVNPTAKLPPAQQQREAIVLRAVPCEDHEEWVRECPRCLTGEEARILGVDYTEVRLGVIADTKWKWWSRERWRARRRILKANKEGYRG